MVRFGLVRSFFDISVNCFDFNEQHLSNSYLDFAWFKISPRLRLAHIGHYMERWNSATQVYLK